MSNQKEHFISIQVVMQSNGKYKLINLPTYEDLEQQIRDFAGNEKYYLTINRNFRGPNLGLLEVNEFSKKIEQYDYTLVEALYECIGSVEDTVICLEEGHFQYSHNISDLSELAEEMTKLGMLGELSEEILRYIDYQKIAKDLEGQGWRIYNNVAVLVY